MNGYFVGCLVMTVLTYEACIGCGWTELSDVNQEIDNICPVCGLETGYERLEIGERDENYSTS